MCEMEQSQNLCKHEEQVRFHNIFIYKCLDIALRTLQSVVGCSWYSWQWIRSSTSTLIACQIDGWDNHVCRHIQTWGCISAYRSRHWRVNARMHRLSMHLQNQTVLSAYIINMVNHTNTLKRGTAWNNYETSICAEECIWRLVLLLLFHKSSS